MRYSRAHATCTVPSKPAGIVSSPSEVAVTSLKDEPAYLCIIWVRG
jgi:hypothetical protein